MLRKFPQYRKLLRRICLSGFFSLICILSADFQLNVKSQDFPEIPTPEAAAQQAETLSLEELTQLEIDDKTRDRLRFHPAWKTVLQEVRQDLMEFKWRDGEISNPVWESYGSSVYPLLDYYTRSQDLTQRGYGLKGIRALGLPYTTSWLEKQLVIGRDDSPFEDFFDIYWKDVLKKEFGLSDPTVRDHLVAIALNGYEIQALPKFNADFLRQVLGYTELSEIGFYPIPSWEEEFTAKENILAAWEKSFEPLDSLSKTQIQEMIASFLVLPVDHQGLILLRRFGPIKAGELSVASKMLLETISNDSTSPYQVWTIAELDRHGAPKATEMIEKFVNQDLERLNELDNLSKRSFFEGFDIFPSGFAEHNYYLLLALTEKYPESRFTRGCIEYGNLRGASYFDQVPRDKSIKNQNLAKKPDEWVKDWRNWLAKYPDHPGADNAIHFLARGLQSQRNNLDATRQWLNLILEPPGDSDLLNPAWPHIRSNLDIGLSVEELKILVEEYSSARMAPLLQYTLAVKQARLQNFSDALSLSATLDLTKIPFDILGSYYGSEKGVTQDVQRQMQMMLEEQIKRWQYLQELQNKNTHEAQYRIAASWAETDGWKNGYLPFWIDYWGEKNWRRFSLPFLNPLVCEYYWVCNFEARDPQVILSNYQKSNTNYIALSLYKQLLDEANLPPYLYEQALYMSAQIALFQLELFPTQETIAIHPLPGMSGEPGIPKLWKNKDFQRELFDSEFSDMREQKVIKEQYGFLGAMWGSEYWLEREILSYEAGTKDTVFHDSMNDIRNDYQLYVDSIIEALKRQFPNSKYIDDLLFGNYFLSDQRSYLDELVSSFPDSDRASEAKFLVDKISSFSN